jgi:hypothetical protein
MVFGASNGDCYRTQPERGVLCLLLTHLLSGVLARGAVNGFCGHWKNVMDRAAVTSALWYSAA